MSALLCLCTALVMSAALHAEGFADFITLINIAPAAERPALVDSLLADLPEDQAPIREADRAWFIYVGEASTVAIAGDMSEWNPYISMLPIGGTDFWYKMFLCEEDARLDYKLVVDGGQWILDPLNPNTCNGGYGPNSELAMPAYLQPEEIGLHGYPEGEVLTWSSVYSPQLGNTRTVRILLPPDYQEGETRDICLVHDGQDYLTLGYLSRVSAWMEARHPELHLPVFVCVPPVNRTEEYAGGQQAAFGSFIMDSLWPMLEDSLDMPGEPDHIMSMGASNGGNISAYLAGTYPEHFDWLILMSPYLPAEQQQLLEARDPASLKVYMNWGSYDIPVLIPLIEESESMFQEQGVDHFSRMYHEGHSWGLWRATIDEAFFFLYDLDTEVGDTGSSLRPQSMQLQAWPNPFNGTLRIEGVPGTRELKVWNLDGRLVQVLNRSQSMENWIWHPQGQASGSYLFEASGRNHVSIGRALYLK